MYPRRKGAPGFSHIQKESPFHHSALAGNGRLPTRLRTPLRDLKKSNGNENPLAGSYAETWPIDRRPHTSTMSPEGESVRPALGDGGRCLLTQALHALKESAKSCVLSGSRLRPTTAAASARPFPSSPGTAGSTTRAIATFYAGRGAIRETPDARRSNQS